MTCASLTLAAAGGGCFGAGSWGAAPQNFLLGLFCPPRSRAPFTTVGTNVFLSAAPLLSRGSLTVSVCVQGNCMTISVWNLFFSLFFFLWFFFLRLIKKSISSSVGLCLTWFWEYLFPKKREVISQIDFAAFVLAHFHLIIFSVLCFAFLDQLTASERSWMDSLGQVLGTDLPCSDLQGGGGRRPHPLLVLLANNIIKCWFNPFPWRLSVLETSSLPSVGPPRPGPSVHGAGQDTESPPPADLLAGC